MLLSTLFNTEEEQALKQSTKIIYYIQTLSYISVRLLKKIPGDVTQNAICVIVGVL